MKSGKFSKMTTTLAVLVLVMSGLMVVQWNAQPVEASEHEGYITIEGFLEPIDEDGTIESDLDIKLRDLSTGDIRTESTSQYYYEFTEVSPGWYEIIFPSQVDPDVDGGIAYMGETTEPFRVSEDTVVDDILVDHEWIEGNTVTGQVEDEDGNMVEDAVVSLEDRERGFHHSVTTEVEEVNGENITTYEIEIYDDFDGTFKVEKAGYAPYINTDFTMPELGTDYDVELSSKPYVEGNLVDEEGRGIREELDITLYNDDIGVLHHTMSGPTFRIRAPAGEYLLVVDAPEYEPLVIDEVTLSEEQRKRIPREETSTVRSGEETFDTHMEFDEIGNLEIETTRTLRSSTRMKTMDYSHIGNLAMQIDLAIGDQDLSLSEEEVEDFQDRLFYSQDLPTSERFITVNDTVYEIDEHDTAFEGFEQLEGDVTELFTGEIEFTSMKTYEAVDVEEASHIIDLTVENDHTFGNVRDFSYTVDLLQGYERYIGPGTEEDIPENVEVEGYTTLEINPMEDGETSDLTFDVRESDEGEVDITITNEPWVQEMEEEDEVDYVIRKGEEVELTADFESETSHPISYEWTWDGEPIDIDGHHGLYTFEEAEEADLEVEVEDSGGFEPSDSLTLVIDDEGPQGDYILVDEKEVEIGQDTSVNEDQEIDFSGEDFYDEATGIVRSYEWNFSDDTEIKEGMNVTHEFDIPDVYEVTLNVTDGVGNSEEYSITVNVNDTTEPIGDFIVEWNNETSSDPIISIVRNTDVTFNATEIEAHPDYEGVIEEYNWTLTDSDDVVVATSEEIIWNYTEFTEAEQYKIELTVIDGAGNNRTIEKDLVIELGDVPDLSIMEDLRFSDDNPRVGDTVTIRVNVTNIGDLDATDVRTRLEVNGDRVDIDEVFYKDGEETENRTIAPGETVTISMEWEPESDGENVVIVNVTDGEEPLGLQFDNEADETINVRQEAWREYLVYALIPIIIIGVVVGLYMFKDRLR